VAACFDGEDRIDERDCVCEQRTRAAPSAPRSASHPWCGVELGLYLEVGMEVAAGSSASGVES
jgi:hypothetical protein